LLPTFEVPEGKMKGASFCWSPFAACEACAADHAASVMQPVMAVFVSFQIP